MQAHSGMTCSSDGYVVGGGRQLDGILGVGSYLRNQVRAIPTGSTVVIGSDGLPDCSKTVGIDFETNPLTNPIDELLNNPIASPLSLSTIGIRWHGFLGQRAGTLFLGEEAKSNEFYRKQDAIGPVWLGTSTNFALNVTGFNLVTSTGAISQSLHFTSGAKNAFIDTGNAFFVLPSALIKMISGGGFATGGGFLSVKLAAAGGGELSLNFPAAQLAQMYRASQLIESEAHDRFVFGAICWLFFDLVVIDVDAQEVTFVPVTDFTKVVVPPMPTALPFGRR